MIWFFLTGMIAGAAGMILYAHWWIGRHATYIHMEEEDDETGHPDGDVPGD